MGLHRRRRANRSYSTFKVRRGDLVQGKEQLLCFAGPAMKRYPTLKVREIQKNIYFCFIDYTKTCDCVIHNKPWKILKGMGIPGHLTCLLRNLLVCRSRSNS